jgi:hypothetical protein
MPKSTPLTDEVSKVAARVRKATKGKINEQNTKASMIEPVLRALGWDTEDVDEVVREFRHRPKDPPVDYGLLVNREPKLFVEAKAFGENLGDQRWANQIMGYASVAGVEWIVLTNGDEYRIYNALAKVHVEKKLFRECRLSQEPCPRGGDPRAARERRARREPHRRAVEGALHRSADARGAHQCSPRETRTGRRTAAGGGQHCALPAISRALGA